ncbi:MAG: S49 family peptidase, partial [Oceanibaculum sp.]
GKIVFAGALDRLGIGHDSVAAGDNATLYSPLEPFTSAQQRQMERALDRIYADFAGKAAAARGLDAGQIDRAARGRVFTGADAGEAGLVDSVGGYAETLQTLRALLGLPDGAPLKLQPFPAPEDPVQAVLDLLRGGEFMRALASLTRLSALLARYEALLGGAMDAPQPLRLPLPDMR